jgi:hypothetical protein
LKNHLRSGKEFVSIGTTFGFADLLLVLPLLSTSDPGPVYLCGCGLDRAPIRCHCRSSHQRSAEDLCW